MLHAKPVLLIHRDKTQLKEGNILLQKGVGADHDVRAAIADILFDLRFALEAASLEQADLDR